VLLVDEASLVSTRDFAALARSSEETGATLRLVGDPAQHSAVAAGGIFRYLVEHHPDETPSLTHLYRQQGEAMAEVRLANAEYREGKITEALERLRRDARITEAESAEEAYDFLVSAWYAERMRRIAEPDRRWSAMTAEHHFERRELNVRARALLAVDGTLKGPELTVAGLSFRSGDEVIARVTERSLRAEHAPRDAYVRNGSLGTVVEVQEHGLVVDFDRWGRVAVPRAYLERQVSPGVVGGLQHAYALTTHSAQGHTFAGASPLMSDASSMEGAYVGITRAQFDLQAVVIRRRDLSRPVADDVLPVLRDETSALLATSRRLQGIGPERLASESKVVRLQNDDEVAPPRRVRKQMEDEIEAELSEAKPSVQSSQLSARRANPSIEERLVIETDRAVAVPSGPTIGP
jgi:ATP-dependent exoDNAse (exonuclease V) alpha subunit